MKRIILSLLTILLTLSFFACSKDGNNKKPDPTKVMLATAKPTQSANTPEVTTGSTPSTTGSKRISVVPDPGPIKNEESSTVMLCPIKAVSNSYVKNTWFSDAPRNGKVVTADIQFVATVPLKAITIHTVTYTQPKGEITFNLYDFDKDFNTSIVGREHVYTLRKEDIKDSEWTKLEFENELPAGEYILRLTDAIYDESYENVPDGNGGNKKKGIGSCIGLVYFDYPVEPFEFVRMYYDEVYMENFYPEIKLIYSNTPTNVLNAPTIFE